ncbi:hypothetical protein [Neorhodopirellula lusitana]|uniref:hypothetical protein n=1 Tax=Neorhodopirellula lusitana TaxID=445327 RepID=UPI00384CF109
MKNTKICVASVLSVGLVAAAVWSASQPASAEAQSLAAAVSVTADVSSANSDETIEEWSFTARRAAASCRYGGSSRFSR